MKSMEELNNEARIRNDQELDKCCKTICLVFGWGLVISLIISLIIYVVILLLNGISNN